MKTKTELKKQYEETTVPMGVFLVQNTKTNEFIIGSSRNLAGTLNKYKFVLKYGKANDLLLKNPKVFEDYQALGEDGFEFKVLDILKPKEEAGWDPVEDLKSLEKIWLDELKSKGWAAY